MPCWKKYGRRKTVWPPKPVETSMSSAANSGSGNDSTCRLASRCGPSSGKRKPGRMKRHWCYGRKMESLSETNKNRMDDVFPQRTAVPFSNRQSPGKCDRASPARLITILQTVLSEQTAAPGSSVSYPRDLFRLRPIRDSAMTARRGRHSTAGMESPRRQRAEGFGREETTALGHRIVALPAQQSPRSGRRVQDAVPREIYECRFVPADHPCPQQPPS